jgi:transporter family-2 protein
VQPLALSLSLIVVAGGLAAVQAPLNAALGRGIDSATGAAAISFAVGFLALVFATWVAGDAGSLVRVNSVDPRLLLGGLLGAIYVWAILWTVPQLGALTAISGMILGQLIVALILDRFGAFGLPLQEITWTRLTGVALVAGGLALSKL